MSPPLSQSAEFAAMMSACGQTPLTVGYGTLALRRRMLGLPVTLLSRARIDRKTLPGLLHGSGLRRAPVILNPDAPCPDLARLGALMLVTPAHVAELDLTGNLRSGLRQKWRNRLNHALRQNLAVRDAAMPQDPGHWLFTADMAQQRARGYRSWPVRLTLAYTRANPGSARLFTALHSGRPVAAILLLLHGRAATYHIGHSTAQGRAVSAHNLLMWHAMTWLAARGITRLDLGPVETESAAGLARFKLGTGANARALGGTWLLWPPLMRGMDSAARNRLFERMFKSTGGSPTCNSAPQPPS
ncbi:GNAT family N-acetyltransferase [Lutimaribacter marinistellae]|uniref:GNAT family N-acetyltransferase n=1 Tax=Lutimaribacter marinistellae TaxID=1820329 RepID=A0ABV7TII2_9RHOB